MSQRSSSTSGGDAVKRDLDEIHSGSPSTAPATSISGKEVESDQLMRAIDQVACAMAKAHTLETASQFSQLSPKDECRLRVPQKTACGAASDDADVDAYRQHKDDVALNDTVTDMTPTALPATQKRTKNEVDVAAEGIALEVRRFQCTKSTLALQEATKNDATPQSSKLVDYLVSLTFGHSGLCTEQEMCEWLVAQVCERSKCGQVWVVAKTYKLLSALLWHGSSSFVTAMHDYGAAMFQAANTVAVLKSTPQENLSGERLPSQLQRIETASAGKKSAAGTWKSRGFTMFAHHSEVKVPAKQAVEEVAITPESVEEEIFFVIANVAYMESLCEYRMRHPTLDLAHGEILTTTARSETEVARVQCDACSPETWKELLDDTLELMKAIAVADQHAPVSEMSRSATAIRVRESMLLYQIACRALVRLLHAVLTRFNTFVASIQAGLNAASASASDCATAPSPSSPLTLSHAYFGGSVGLGETDFSVTPKYVFDKALDYYFAIYQFNRTVNMLRDYCASSDRLDCETIQKAMAAFKLLPEASLYEFKDSRKVFAHPHCFNTMETLHRAARQFVQRRDCVTGKGDCAGNASINLVDDEEVRHSMKALYDFHSANGTFQSHIWTRQVDAVCSLFDEKEATMLHHIFDAGLTGLYVQWQEFTNNGGAAAEKALMAMEANEHFTQQEHGPAPPGLAAAPREEIRDAGATSASVRHSLPSTVQVRGSAGFKTEFYKLKIAEADLGIESAIDALLQEDDVVVICNEECSCNDTMKLVDRFQVLMDVPLGEGSYGRVYRAWDEAIGCYLAAKELPLDSSKAHNVAVREVLQEYTVLTELSHPNIVRVVAFMVLRRTARIYMEWVPSGSLQDVLRHHPRGMLRESVVRRYARDVLSGLAFLHSRGVIHRDVKPGNMLLSSDGAVKLTDFGTSLVLSGNHRTLESGAVTGTAAYMAPESVQGTYSSASDIWSFACSVVQLIGGGVPWCSPTTESMPEPIALLFKVGSLDDTTHLERPHDALKAAAKAAAKAAQTTAELATGVGPLPESDVDAGETVKEGASAELLDMLDSIFVVDRKKRPSASELLQHAFFKAELVMGAEDVLTSHWE